MADTTESKAISLEDLEISIIEVFNKVFGNSGTCSTAADTAAKTVTLGTIFSLDNGCMMLVKFTNGITSENSTLAVTHTTLAGTTVTENAKPIYLNGAALEAGVIQEGALLILRYNGTQFDIISCAGSGGQNQVVQTTGQSTTAVMSQKAVSDLVPAQASSSNQLADKDFVNSSITTATATYRGSYNLVSDLSLTISASHGQIETALNTAATGADNNDYCFVQIPTADATPTEIASVERYKHNGTTWSYEYAINNSGFTAAQWAAVNSGITSGLVAKLGQLTGNTYSAQNGLAGLFGIDNNGAWQNIVPSDLASVLSGMGYFILGKCQQFGSGSANYIVDSGYFLCWDAVTDLPEEYGGFLESVVPDKNALPNFRKQTFTSQASPYKVYTRIMWGGSGQPWGGNWTPWKEIG